MSISKHTWKDDLLGCFDALLKVIKNVIKPLAPQLDEILLEGAFTCFPPENPVLYTVSL